MSCVCQQGVIRCECASWDLARRMECVASRTRYLHAAAIAKAPDNETRKRIINALPQRERPAVRRTAIQIMRETHA